METQADIVLPDGGPSFSAGTPFTKLIDAGVEGEAVLAPFVLEAVMQELGTQDDFPVLIAIDDFQALAGRSLYRDPRFKTIRPHHLSMPRLLLEYATGRKKLVYFSFRLSQFGN
jgi:small subunit ribosomal protein S29